MLLSSAKGSLAHVCQSLEGLVVGVWGGGVLQMDTDKHQLKMEERGAFEWSDLPGEHD